MIKRYYYRALTNLMCEQEDGQYVLFSDYATEVEHLKGELRLGIAMVERAGYHNDKLDEAKARIVLIEELLISIAKPGEKFTRLIKLSAQIALGSTPSVCSDHG